MQNGIHFYNYHRIREYYMRGGVGILNMEIGNVMHNGNHFYLDCNIRQYVILSHVERHIQSCISIIFHYQIPRCSGSKVLCTSSQHGYLGAPMVILWCFQNPWVPKSMGTKDNYPLVDGY